MVIANTPVFHKRLAARGYYVTGKSLQTSAPPHQTGHAIFPHPAFLLSSNHHSRGNSQALQAYKAKMFIHKPVPCHPFRWTDRTLTPTFQVFHKPMTKKVIHALKPNSMVKAIKVVLPSSHLVIHPGRPVPLLEHMSSVHSPVAE